MVALRAWYDPDDDDEPILVTSTEEVDGVLDRLAADRAAMRVPPMMQLSRRDTEGWAVLHVGVGVDGGVLTHTDTTGTYVTTDGTTSTGAPLVYDYMGHLREVPANAKIAAADVRKAVHEFVDTNGARPTSVEWQADE